MNTDKEKKSNEQADKGNHDTIDTITELEPRIVETEPEETPEEPEEITEVVPQEPEKSQKEIFDELTGQTSLFGTDEITE